MFITTLRISVKEISLKSSYSEYAEGLNFIMKRGAKSCTIHAGFRNESEVHEVSDSLPTLFWVVDLFVTDGCSCVLLVALVPG